MNPTLNKKLVISGIGITAIATVFYVLTSSRIISGLSVFEAGMYSAPIYVIGIATIAMGLWWNHRRQKIVEKSELQKYLDHGWRVKTTLDEEKVVIQR